VVARVLWDFWVGGGLTCVFWAVFEGIIFGVKRGWRWWRVGLGGGSFGCAQDDSVTGDGKGKKQIPGGNDRKKGNYNGKGNDNRNDNGNGDDPVGVVAVRCL
jgi:hypothetical protein